MCEAVKSCWHFAVILQIFSIITSAIEKCNLKIQMLINFVCVNDHLKSAQIYKMSYYVH